MKAYQLTLDEDLVARVDKVAKRIKSSRSEFARNALTDALSRLETLELERKHRESYQRHPLKKNEAGAWEKEQEQGWPEWIE